MPDLLLTPELVLGYSTGILITLILLIFLRGDEDSTSDLMILSVLFPFIPIYIVAMILSHAIQGVFDFLGFRQCDNLKDDDHTPYPYAPYNSQLPGRRDGTGKWDPSRREDL